MSSFLGDLIGNLGIAGGAVTKDYIDHQQALEKQKYESDLAMERARAAETLRAEFETKRDQIKAAREEADRVAKQKRLSEQGQAIEAQTPAVTAARQLLEAQRVAPSVDSNVMDIIKSKLTPAQIRQYYGVDDSQAATITDSIGIARKHGYYDIEEGLLKERTAAVAAAKAALDERRQLHREAKDDREGDQRDRQLDIMAGRAAGSGSGGANKVQSSYTNDQGYRVHTMTDGSTVIARDSDGKPITTESFAKRVEDKVKWLKKDGGAAYRKLSAEELAVEARKLLLQQDGVGVSVAPPRAGQFKVIR